MVVVDSTPECMNALRFAARRAHKIGRGVTMLYVVEPEAPQFWAGVGKRIRDEAFAEAEERLLTLADEVRDVTGILPEFVIREGDPIDEVMDMLGGERGIAILVLGSSASGDGPGPLVSALTGSHASKLPIPLTIVPGGMTLEEIDALT